MFKTALALLAMQTLRQFNSKKKQANAESAIDSTEENLVTLKI
jgi:hypothetical protein